MTEFIGIGIQSCSYAQMFFKLVTCGLHVLNFLPFLLYIKYMFWGASFM